MLGPVVKHSGYIGIERMRPWKVVTVVGYGDDMWLVVGL